MMVLDQSIEQRLVRCAAHQPEFQRPQIFEASFDWGIINIGNAGTLVAKQWIVRSDFDRWQMDMSCAVQRQHQSTAYHAAWRAIRLDPIPCRT